MKCLRTPCVTKTLRKYSNSRPTFNASAVLQIITMSLKGIWGKSLYARCTHRNLTIPLHRYLHTHNLTTVAKLGWTSRHGKASHHWATSIGIRYQKKTRQESFPFGMNPVLVHPRCNPSPFNKADIPCYNQSRNSRANFTEGLDFNPAQQHAIAAIAFDTKNGNAGTTGFHDI